MKKGKLLLALHLVAMAASAQLMDMQTQLYFTRLTTNPALTAYNGSTNVHGFFRDQWSGVPNHPRIGGGIGELSLWNDRIGTGIEVMAYSGGTSRIVDAKLYYAQKINLGKDHRLSLGISAGMLQYNTNFNTLSNPELVSDPNFNQPANSLFDMNIGLAYQWRKLTVGFAIPNLLDGNTRVYNNLSKLEGFNRNYIINGSYEISFAKGKFNLEPVAVFRIDQNKAFNMKMQVMADYKKIVFLGAGYNLYGGIPVTAGVRISKIFTVAYGYQLPIMRNIPVGGIHSSHEVMISVNFDKWMKKGDKTKEAAKTNAPQQSAYDSLLARQAAADALAAEQQAEVQDLTKKVEALQQALTNAEKKEQEQKLDALNRQIEAKQQQQAENKAKEEAAKAAAAQQAKAAAEQQAKMQEAAAKMVAEQQAKEAAAKAQAEQQAKTEAAKAEVKPEPVKAAPVNEEVKTAPAKTEPVKAEVKTAPAKAPKTETAAPAAKPETKTTAQGYEIIAEAPALPAQSETKAAPKEGERFSLGSISVERDGSKLNESAYAELDKLVNYLKLHKDTRVRIVGHGDGYDIEEQSGFRSYKRAKRVAEYLETKGIPLTQFTYAGMGPRKPIADNSTEEGRAKNFRIEVEIIK